MTLGAIAFNRKRFLSIVAGAAGLALLHLFLNPGDYIRIYGFIKGFILDKADKSDSLDPAR